MTVDCINLVVNDESGYPNTAKLKLEATCDQQVTKYEWSIDTIPLSDESQNIIIELNTISIGKHAIALRTLSDCNVWSGSVTKEINVICGLPICNYDISN